MFLDPPPREPQEAKTITFLGDFLSTLEIATALSVDSRTYPLRLRCLHNILDCPAG